MQFSTLLIKKNKSQPLLYVVYVHSLMFMGFFVPYIYIGVSKLLLYIFKTYSQHSMGEESRCSFHITEEENKHQCVTFPKLHTYQVAENGFQSQVQCSFLRVIY